MAAEKIDDKPTVYLVGETPDTVDKIVFDFSKLSYMDGRDIDALQGRIRRKEKQIADALASDDIEALAEKLEALIEEQKLHITKHNRPNKMLSVRITRLEMKIENWKEIDLDGLYAESKALQDEQELNLLKGVTYVPQSWLIVGAPMASGINWADHSNLKYLRGDKFLAIMKAKSAAQNDSPN